MKYKSLHTCIRVTNLEKSIEFYEKALGMEVTSKKDFPEDEFTLVYMTSDHDYEIELTYNYGKTDYTHGDSTVTWLLKLKIWKNHTNITNL